MEHLVVGGVSHVAFTEVGSNAIRTTLRTTEVGANGALVLGDNYMRAPATTTSVQVWISL